MNNREMNELNEGVSALLLSADKRMIEKNMKGVGQLAIKFFNYALSQQDATRRFNMVEQAVEKIKSLVKY
ncbi:MAG: hypothetical protein HY939_08085, partial [Gammaproteobacteria bacterium]|nr:hypothetical protein [Gammaproteobacteria bacterium]